MPLLVVPQIAEGEKVDFNSSFVGFWFFFFLVQTSFYNCRTSTPRKHREEDLTGPRPLIESRTFRGRRMGKTSTETEVFQEEPHHWPVAPPGGSSRCVCLRAWMLREKRHAERDEQPRVHAEQAMERQLLHAVSSL